MSTTLLYSLNGPQLLDGGILRLEKSCNIVANSSNAVYSLSPNVDGGHNRDEQGDERGEHEDGLALGGAPHRPGELAVQLKAQLKSTSSM